MMSRAVNLAHWEDLEAWISIMTDSLLPKVADKLRNQSQEQLDDSIRELMAHNPSQSYNHKELAKITGSLAHNLLTQLKLIDTKAMRLEQEVEELWKQTREAQQDARQTQQRLEGTDRREQEAKDEIKRLQVVLEDLQVAAEQ
ncbi:uncharacterized protein LOC128318437 [Pangasianodon hypophthalmus]|uniref:uncharacterized protein LOC128318437 n=1 Tax=Pangasianodon hypophthalmus TaxID=310915 RepID=UPI000EFF75EA|nr:uncharacterized protein LOC128318437 [Pangasianodon hypophthalmus]